MKTIETRKCAICKYDFRVKNISNRKTCCHVCSLKYVDLYRIEYRNKPDVKAKNIKCQHERYKKKQKELCVI